MCPACSTGRCAQKVAVPRIGILARRRLVVATDGSVCRGKTGIDVNHPVWQIGTRATSNRRVVMAGTVWTGLTESGANNEF